MDALQTASPPTPSDSRNDLDLHRRIRAEFGEMPGLKLTLRQAARLFNIEPGRCERVLGALVAGGELSTDGKTFVRASTGRLWPCRSDGPHRN